MSNIRYYISSIDIEGFRGINNSGYPLNLSFNIDKANSVFAPNGLGKSSIFDALCFAIKGYIPRIDKMQKTESGDSYYINKFHSTGEATIAIVFKPDDGSNKDVKIIVKRNKKGLRSVSSKDIPNPEEFLKSLDNECTLIDYETFNEFISNSPLSRGRTFSSLVGQSKMSSLKQAIDTLSNTRSIAADFETNVLKSEMESIKNNIERYIKDINNYIIELGGTTSDKFDENTVINFVKNKLLSNAFLKPHVINLDFKDIKFDNLLSEVKLAEGGQLRDTLVINLRELTELNTFKSPDIMNEKNELSILYNKLIEKERLIEKGLGDAFYRLFRSAKDIFENNEWGKNTCPLCKTTIVKDNVPTIYEDVLLYIEEYSKIDELKTESFKLWDSFSAKKRLLTAEKKLIKTEEDMIFLNIDSKFKEALINSSDILKAIENLSTTNQHVLSNIKLKEVEIENIKSKLPPSLIDTIELIEKCKQIQNNIGRFSPDKIKYFIKRKKLLAVNRWVEFITNASNELNNAESALSVEICKDIESSASTFFKEIMGREEIQLSLSRSKDSENLLLLLSKFYGINNINALPVLSESYRNAFAISIFLAALMRQNSKSRFIVLDDITSSFDAGRQFMLMEVLRKFISVHSDAYGVQVILFTHDGLLEKYFDSSSDDWSHIKLQGLPPSGNVISNRQQPEKLKTVALKQISNGQVESSYPLIRQYLEFKMTEIIKKLQIPVPIDFAIRDDKKMIGNSYDAIMNSIELHNKANSLALYPSQIKAMSSINVPIIVSNMINHYETASKSSLSPHIFLSVIDSIDNFADCFMYDCTCSGKTTRRYFKTLSSKACKCV